MKNSLRQSASTPRRITIAWRQSLHWIAIGIIRCDAIYSRSQTHAGIGHYINRYNFTFSMKWHMLSSTKLFISFIGDTIDTVKVGFSRLPDFRNLRKCVARRDPYDSNNCSKNFASLIATGSRMTNGIFSSFSFWFLFPLFVSSRHIFLCCCCFHIFPSLKADNRHASISWSPLKFMTCEMILSTMCGIFGW